MRTLLLQPRCGERRKAPGANDMSAWHEEVLNKRALQVAEILAEELPDDFYLAGGTGLALYAGHRISIDFDLFSPKNLLPVGFRNTVIKSLKAKPRVEIRRPIDLTQ